MSFFGKAIAARWVLVSAAVVALATPVLATSGIVDEPGIYSALESMGSVTEPPGLASGTSITSTSDWTDWIGGIISIVSLPIFLIQFWLEVAMEAGMLGPVVLLPVVPLAIATVIIALSIAQVALDAVPLLG